MRDLVRFLFTAYRAYRGDPKAAAQVAKTALKIAREAKKETT